MPSLDDGTWKTAVRIGEDDKERVREATDLVRLIGEHIALQQRGREWVGLCPFHDDSSPSMAVVTHKGNAFYKCHACGAGGDAFTFVMAYHQMGFREALEYLAGKTGIQLTAPAPRDQDDAGGPSISRERLRKANAFAARHFQNVLEDEKLGAVARQALADRGVLPAMVALFQIGAAADAWDNFLRTIDHQPDSVRVAERAGLLRTRNTGDGHYDTFRNRLIFPIHDESGRPIAFGARKLNPEDEPKYLNSPESPIFQKSKTLYGLHQARRSIIETRTAIVTEGYTDVIACHQNGITNVVGTLGTALTEEHAKILNRIADTVVLLFDGDEAGQRAADRGIEVFFAQTLDVRVCVLPDNQDPDDLLRTPDGPAKFEAAVQNAADAMAYAIGRIRTQLEALTSLSAREKRLEAFLVDLARLGLGHVDGKRKQHVLGALAPLYGRSVNELNLQITRLAQAERRTTRSGASMPEPGAHQAAVDEASSLVRPARRRAEREFISMLLAQPALLDHPAAVVPSSTVAEWLTETELSVPAYRDIAAALVSLHASKVTISVQGVMDAVYANEHARAQVPDLFMQATSTVDASEDFDFTARLESAVQALHDEIIRAKTDAALLTGREQIAGAPDTATAAAAADALIEQIRKRGGHAAAIGQGRT
ncbi:MAG: DNA primase [Phycisphaerales bacterium]|nr:DNA primase [Phycisphaerales bacterium]